MRAWHTEAMRPILATVLLVLVLPALAETIAGRVVGISDGDTVTVLDGQNVQHKIRLAGIDAPEKGQSSETDPKNRCPSSPSTRP